MTKLVLASGSPRRAELLLQVGLDFTVHESKVEEQQSGDEDPREFVKKQALAKAENVASCYKEEAVVIAADTIVYSQGRVMGKPSSRKEAREMLAHLSGRSHLVFTGLAIIKRPAGEIGLHVEVTKVTMRQLVENEISWYLDSGEPFDKAGAYGIQGRAAVFTEKLEGCYFNVVGLPLASLWRLLGDMGITL